MPVCVHVAEGNAYDEYFVLNSTLLQFCAVQFTVIQDKPVDFEFELSCVRFVGVGFKRLHSQLSLDAVWLKK